ncbi:hypothetical protein PUN28_002649 [Cardiocondyla obscurior]|uniref:Potassium channel domain-containing protein n=1 Tax=Cardiocondyla obscurior TaxID=286306 RepID=A0AAW2GVC5_9HYME
MEDSYIVHRRRKAAARKREKTPDPSLRGASRIDTSDDEDEERRARMERMAEEAEKMEQHQKENRLSQQQKQDVPVKDLENRDKKEDGREQRPARRKDKTDARHSANADDMIAIRAEVAAKSTAGNSTKTRESDAAAAGGNGTQLIKQVIEVAKKTDDGTTKKDVVKSEIAQVVKDGVVQETPEMPKEMSGETGRSTEARKVEKRFKRKSKERVEKYSRSTDSSDVDEKSEPSRQRTKSPEIRSRMKKTSGKSRLSDPEAQKKDAERLNREKRSSSRHKLEDEPQRDNNEKPRSTSYDKIEDTGEDLRTIKRNENVSPKPIEGRILKRSSIEMKKQIIPLSNESLIEDFARAQREYLMKERSILDPEIADVYQDAVESGGLRKRKFSLAYSESECEDLVQNVTQSSSTADKKKSWFSWLSFRREKNKDEDTAEKEIEDQLEPVSNVEEIKVEKEGTSEKITLLNFFRALRDIVSEFKIFVAQNPHETIVIRRLRNRCIAELLLVIIYCGLGGFVFRFVEGAFETFYKCGVKRVKRDFLDTLWNYSHNLREDDWKSMARRKLMEFEEQLHTAHEAGLNTYSGQKSWSFLNAVVYCLTVITTIGYGHISPRTDTGRAITIVYAIFGIPMFLIILADFGKLFTRGIKFLWAFVRRLYYTGSCRKVRRTVPVQEVMKGMQLVYDLAKFRRPSQMNPKEIEEIQRQQAQQQQTVLNVDATAPDTPGTPGTPALSAFAIDDEFNLPISVAIVILLAYIFIGASLYALWEQWSFFESFYFVFISMSTIGFGDYVPQHPIYMMCSIVYLVFGLALTSMCINVVQVMLSDSFKQASQKIGATIGFEVAEDDNSVTPAPPPPVEVADVHMSTKESENSEKIAPKAKQEDVDL